MLSDSFLDKVKEQLLAEKSQLTEKTSQTYEIDVDGDETDEIQGNLLIEIQNQLSSRNSGKLRQINDALEKIKNKSYGLCQDCGGLIPEKRLSVNLYFVTCISCAEDRESENRKRL